MEIMFPPEVEAKLQRAAAETGCAPNELVIALVTSQLAYDAWFHEQVAEGQQSLDQERWISHEDVLTRIKQILHS